jgi:hypothetical protein
MTLDTTYRVIVIGDRNWLGETASTPELAKLAAGEIDRSRRLGLEQTDWVPHFDKLKPTRTVLIDAESHPGEWVLGT